MPPRPRATVMAALCSHACPQPPCIRLAFTLPSCSCKWQPQNPPAGLAQQRPCCPSRRSTRPSTSRVRHLRSMSSGVLQAAPAATTTPQLRDLLSLIASAEQLAHHLGLPAGMDEGQGSWSVQLQQQQPPPAASVQAPRHQAPREASTPLNDLAAAAAAALQQQQQQQQMLAAQAPVQQQPEAALLPGRQSDGTQQARELAAAAAAANAAPARKSELLVVADQLGSGVLAAALAAVQAGEPLSYQGLMAQLQAQWRASAQAADLAGTLGSKLQPSDASGLDVQQLRKLFYYSQDYAQAQCRLKKTMFKRSERELGLHKWPQRQFMSVVEALNFLAEKRADSKDAADVPGRMLVLHHAWWLLSTYPNMNLEAHPAAAVMSAKSKQQYKARKRTSADMEEADDTATAAAAAASARGGGGGGATTVALAVRQAAAAWPEQLRYLEQQAQQHLALPPVAAAGAIDDAPE